MDGMPDEGISNQGRFSHNCFRPSSCSENLPEKPKGATMNQDDERILKVAKEIVVKFIEVGRISPSNFEDHFSGIFWAIKKTLLDARSINAEEILDGNKGKK